MLSRVASLATRSLSRHVRTFATGGQQIAALSQSLPHLDVVQYEHKNRVWSLQHVDYYSEALAIGIVENGLQTGDVVLSWMPDHFAEQMVLQFACSKAGLVLYTLDASIAKTDKAEQALAKALELTQANVLITPEAHDDINFIHITQNVIPELRIFDFTDGMPFVTPRFPHLRLPVHTGFDQDDKAGWLLLKHLVVPSDNLKDYIPVEPSGATPLAGELVLENGVPSKVGKVRTNDEVLKDKVWPTYSAILGKQFHAVEGVGVVF